MPTIDFDYGKWCDSQFYGYPKNGNWAKFPQWAAEVVSSNHDTWSEAVTDAKNAHRYTGNRSGVYFDQAGDVSSATWQDHLKAVTDAL